MKLNSIFATCCIAAMATAATTTQAAEYTDYIGRIPVAHGAIPLAAGPDGKLFYGTKRDGGNSQLRVIDNPEAEIGSSSSDVGTTIGVFPGFINSRGFQGLSVSADGILFAAADNAGGASLLGSLFKYDPVASGETTTYVEDTAFRSNIESSNPGRRSGVAVINSTGNGLIAASGFASASTIDYFDFTGTRVGTQLSETLLYYRELQYNPIDGVIYPLRAGKSNNDMLRSYVENVDPTTGGGNIVQKILIDDGANNPGSVEIAQNGYYHAAEHQLITCDQRPTTSTEFSGSRYQVRVWDIIEDGTSLTLAYAVHHDVNDPEFAAFSIPFDAAVIDDTLYVTRGSSNNNGGTAIFAYGVEGSAVKSWELY